MIAIFWKEWRCFFRSLRGFVTLALFGALSGLFVTVYHLIYGTAAFETVLALLSVGVAFLLPLLTVPMLTDSRGEEEGLLSLLPLGKREVYLGKYLFGVALLLLMGAILGAVPLLLGYLGEPNLLAAYVALLGFLLLEHTVLCLCLFVSASLRKPAAAYAVCYGLLALLVLLQTLSGLLTGTGRRIVETLSLFGAFSALGESRAELRALILYLSLTALFLLLFLGKARAKKEKRGLRLAASLGAGAILLNTLVLLLPARATQWDLTEAGTYTLSENTETYLGSLDRDVTLYVMNADRSDRKLEAYLQTLASVSPRLTVRYAKAAEHTELLARVNLTTDTTLAYTIVAESEARATYMDYIDLFYYENANPNVVSLINYLRAMSGSAPTADSTARLSPDEYATYYNFLSGNESYAEYFAALVADSYLYFQGELLTSMIEYVATDLIPKEYTLTGHGETGAEGTLLAELLSLLGEEGYTPLTLSEVGEIPADAAAVLLANPTVDYSESELEILRAYLERGGTLTVVTGQSNLTDTPRLMSLLASYGLTAEAETVREDVTAEAEGTDGEAGSAETATETVELVDVKVNTAHASFATLSGESGLAPAVKKGNPIIMSPTEDPSLIHTALLTTSEKAYLGENKEQSGSFVLAAAAENDRGARLVWMTGGEGYAVSAESYEDGELYGVFLLAMAMEWSDLVFRSQVIPGAGTLYEASYLAASENAALAVGIVTILVLPLALTGIGWGIRYKRRRA